jgi:hypothetical protein
MDEPFFVCGITRAQALGTPSSHAGQAAVGAVPHSVRQYARPDHFVEANKMIEHLPTDDAEGGIE